MTKLIGAVAVVTLTALVVVSEMWLIRYLIRCEVQRLVDHITRG